MEKNKKKAAEILRRLLNANYKENEIQIETGYENSVSKNGKEKADQLQNAEERLLNGTATINQIRNEMGLLELKDCEVSATRENKNKCKHCKSTRNSNKANFCCDCGKKLKEVCDCEFMKGKYNCNKSTCPAYGVFLIAKHRSQTK